MKKVFNIDIFSLYEEPNIQINEIQKFSELVKDKTSMLTTEKMIVLGENNEQTIKKIKMH